MSTSSMALKMPNGKAIGATAKEAAIATLGAMAATFATSFAPADKPNVKTYIQGGTLVGGLFLASASSNVTVKAAGIGMAIISALGLARTGLNALNGLDSIAGVKIPDGLKKFANKLVPVLSGVDGGDVSITPEEQAMLMGLFGNVNDATVYPELNGMDFKFAGPGEQQPLKQHGVKFQFAA